jgi:membrane-associated phospholipid phosphatase
MFVKTIRNNLYFLLPYLVLLLFLVPFLLLYTKADIHIWINQHNSGISDIAFALLTYLGDGLFLIIPCVILLFYSLRHFVFILSTYLATGLVVQILKRIFFHDIMRPSKLLFDKSLHLVDGVELLSGRSFPSGHSTSAFALFLCLALITSNKTLKFGCLIIACLVAFSRIYLSQHFLIDTIAGSLIGTTGALGIYLVLYRNDKEWHNWNIRKLFKNESGKFV